jgi:hypothetical protein
MLDVTPIPLALIFHCTSGNASLKENSLLYDEYLTEKYHQGIRAYILIC